TVLLILLFGVNSSEQLYVKKQTVSKVFLRPFSGKPGFDVLFVPELPQPQQVVLLCVPRQNHLKLKPRGNLP
ncbi:hypothetical protein, partial [Klebsiella grimontii]|uniref:hypothetical protein n=1 Tax=Klebsiella grimontii TaxID=2058152 RepID=UPI001C499BBF